MKRYTMSAPHSRLRARIAEALGIYPAEQDVDAILRACWEAIEAGNIYEHGPRYVVMLNDLRALFGGKEKA